MSQRVPVLTKRPLEVFSIGLKYQTPDLQEGEEIVSCTTDLNLDVGGSLQLVGNCVVEEDNVAQLIAGGVHGEGSYVEFTTVTSGGHTYVDSIFVKVRNLT